MPLKVHPDIVSLVPYVPGKPIEELQREMGLPRAVKLASNENPIGPSPKAMAVLAETGIAREISGPFDRGGNGPGGWLILVEPELHLSGHVLVPDLAGWRRERLPVTPDGTIDVVPDWACEILSPSTAVKDRTLKLPLYAQLGVGHAWIADAQAKIADYARANTGRKWILGQGWDAARWEPMHSGSFLERLNCLQVRPVKPIWDMFCMAVFPFKCDGFCEEDGIWMLRDWRSGLRPVGMCSVICSISGGSSESCSQRDTRKTETHARLPMS